MTLPGVHLDLSEKNNTELFQLLESSDLNVLEGAILLIRENLGSTTDSTFLHGLIDYYIQSGNSFARDSLCMIRQHQHKVSGFKINTVTIY